MSAFKSFSRGQRRSEGGASIYLPSELRVKQPFPDLYATRPRSGTSLIVIIGQQQLLAHVFDNPPRSSPTTEVRVVRNGSVAGRYPGREFIWELIWQRNEQLVHEHAFVRIVDLGPARTWASFQGGGDGPYEESCREWEEILASFEWDPEAGAALRLDGDEQKFRAKFRKPPKLRKVKLPDVEGRISYLRPAIHRLMQLRSQDIESEFDSLRLEELVAERVHGLSATDAQDCLDEDGDALKDWIDEDPRRRGVVLAIAAALVDVWFQTNDSDRM
jgi:hypothetical protein